MTDEHRVTWAGTHWVCSCGHSTEAERSAGAAPLDVERLAEAWFVGIQHRAGLDSRAALNRWNDGSEDMEYMRGVYLDVARVAVARLSERSK